VDNDALRLEIIYVDLPDLIELGVSLRCRGWTAHSTAYTSPTQFAERAAALARWVQTPSEPFRMEAGTDNGTGWLALRFYTTDRAGHAASAVEVATYAHGNEPRPAEAWRCAIEMPTELGLIEEFAGECVALARDHVGCATLFGRPE
jgi:hypothetical protein